MTINSVELEISAYLMLYNWRYRSISTT